MTSFETLEALRFLAQSDDELVRYLPEDEEDLRYCRTDDDGFTEVVQEPSKAAGLACLRVMHEQFARVDDEELARLVGEMISLLYIMDTMSSDSSYFWMVDKSRCIFTGPCDHFWAILRRLASEGLGMADAEVRPPQTPFGDFIKLGGYSKWKLRPASDG